MQELEKQSQDQQQQISTLQKQLVKVRPMPWTGRFQGAPKPWTGRFQGVRVVNPWQLPLGRGGQALGSVVRAQLVSLRGAPSSMHWRNLQLRAVGLPAHLGFPLELDL